MADSSVERREMLATLAFEVDQSNGLIDTSDWPQEFRDLLVDLFRGLLSVNAEIESHKLAGTDTNEVRRKLILNALNLGRGTGKPPTNEVMPSLMLKLPQQNSALRVLLALKDIPYTLETVEEIANTPRTVESVCLANGFVRSGVPVVNSWKLSDGKSNLKPSDALKQVAAEVDSDPDAVSKNYYKHRGSILGLPEFHAFILAKHKPHLNTPQK